MSSNTSMCVSDEQLAIYQSPFFLLLMLFNCSVFFITYYWTIKAVRRLLRASIIPPSTRIFLLTTLFFACLHQTSYLAIKIRSFYKIFSNLNNPCGIYERVSDCYWIISGLLAGNFGIFLMQTTMTLDRVFATVFCHCSKLSVSVIISTIVLIVSSMFYNILSYDDPLDSMVATCGHSPLRIVNRYDIFIKCCLVLSFLDIVIDTILIRHCYLKNRTHRYNVNDRYQSHETLKCAQSFFLLSLAHFLFTLTYSSIFVFLHIFASTLSLFGFTIFLQVLYLIPYFCMLTPILIAKVMKYIKSDRLKNIKQLTSYIDSQEEHMKRIGDMWK